MKIWDCTCCISLPRRGLCVPLHQKRAAALPGWLWWADGSFPLTSLLCLLAHVVASVCAEDAHRPDHSLAPVSPAEGLLSVEPLILTKAPREISQEDPQPSTSSSRFCIGSPAGPGPRVAGGFRFLMSLLLEIMFLCLENNTTVSKNTDE